MATWVDRYFRTGLLPDGRKPVSLLDGVDENGAPAVYACFDPALLERREKGLPIPWPGDGPAPDGYVTPWERI
jgi:hypothetical protein